MTAPLAPDSADTPDRGNLQNKINKLILSNRSASTGQTRISPLEYDEDEDDGDVGEDAILVGREDDIDFQNTGGLSSKAGIILVSPVFFS